MTPFIHWFSQLTPLAKVAAFFGIWIFLWLPIALPLSYALQWRPFRSVPPSQKLPLVLSLYAIAPVVLWGVAPAERIAGDAQSLQPYGLVGQWSELGAIGLGLGIGVLGVSALVMLECGLGWATWLQPPSGAVLALTLLLALSVSGIEEPVFRGFLLNQFQATLPTWLALTSTSVIFALLHLVWEGRSALPQLPGLWLMGAVLGLARWADGGNLGLAIGLHAGWIWAMATLDAGALIQRQPSPRIWVTGVNEQPLAGAIGLLLLLVTGGIVWLMGRWTMGF